jgi:hypothetical protein
MLRLVDTKNYFLIIKKYSSIDQPKQYSSIDPSPPRGGVVSWWRTRAAAVEEEDP